MIRTAFIAFFCFIFCQNIANAQTKKKFFKSIDSLLQTTSIRPFNGSVFIAQNGKSVYSRHFGFGDILQKKQPITIDNQFIVGSLSKQITAVLVLQAYQKGRVKLHVPIRKYLPEMKQTWADSVTVHQLLNHTSGVDGFDNPLRFKAGTGFSYSNTGYAILGQIVAKLAKKPYANLVNDVFKKCKMKHSAFPNEKNTANLLTGYCFENGKIEAKKASFNDLYIPAAGLMTTAEDLVLWNQNLHNGKLLRDSVYQKMIKASAVRNHPIFGNVPYGYALQMAEEDGIAEIGHGGYATGFVAVNFYYPKTKVSIVVLENLDWKNEDMKLPFSFETQLRKMVRQSFLVVKCK